VAVIEKHTLDNANTITLIKHKHRFVTLGGNIRIYDATMVVIMFGTIVYC